MQRTQPVQRARQIALLVASLLALSLLLMVLDNRNVLDPVKAVVADVVTPISRALTGAGSSLRPATTGDAELRRQLEEVTGERDRLLAESARLQEQVVENEQLRHQLDFRTSHPELESLTASVIGRDPQGVEKFIIIDRGADDGVEPGMAVVSPDYLVGEVVDVEPGRAKVLLVVDAAFQTGARLQISRGAGIVYGLWQAGGRAEMRHVQIDTKVDPAELVVTSGRTLMIPEGLIIGRIIDIERDELGSEIKLAILPLVDFDAIETVTVITGQREQ